jgi:hypothetical protein
VGNTTWIDSGLERTSSGMTLNTVAGRRTRRESDSPVFCKVAGGKGQHSREIPKESKHEGNVALGVEGHSAPQRSSL